MVNKKEKKLIGSINKFAVRRGNFTLSSGETSTYYIDLKDAYTRPEVMREITEVMTERIRGLEIDRIGGMELGAVPIAVALSLTSGIPFFIVRKEKKGYGAGKRIEGRLEQKDKVILVEDVATTGGSIASASRAINEAGGTCLRALAVVDRLGGAKENLKKINIELESLLTIRDLGL